MATSNQYLIFKINLTDPVQVTTLQNSLHVPDGDSAVVGNGVGAILTSPDHAGVRYSAPVLGPHEPFVAPSITSEWFGTKDQFPVNLATFDRKSGGWFGWSWLFGDTTHYYWRGIFNYVPLPDLTLGPTPPPVPLPFSRRKWIDGFELPELGEAPGGGALTCSRGSSRHVQGFGLALHHASSTRTHNTNTFGDAFVNKAWERFYVRFRNFQIESAPCTLWRARTNFSPASGIAIRVLAAGQLAVYHVDGSSNFDLVGAFAAPALDTWARIDLWFAFGQRPLSPPLGPLPSLTVWINGTVVFTFTDVSSGEQANGTVHTSSELGGLVANTMAVDVDDWMCAAQPPTPDGIDFQSGCAMRLVSPTALDPSTTWAGDFRLLLQNPAENLPFGMTSSAAGAPLLAETDGLDVIGAEPQGIGMVGMVVSVKTTTLIAGTTLGLSGGAELTGTLSGPIAQLGGQWENFLYLPTPAGKAIQVTHPIKLSLIHGAAGLSTVKAMFGVAEILGAFGPEDTPHITPAPKVPTPLGIHNAPYPRTPWATLTTPPIQPVYEKTGSYIGNATGQDLLFPVPIHLYIVRPLTPAGPGAIWWPSLMGAHASGDQAPSPQHMVQALIDPAFLGASEDYEGFPAPLPPPPATVVDAMDLANKLAYGFPKHTDASYWTGLGYLSDPVYFFGRMLGNGAGAPDIAPYGLYAVPPSRWNVHQQQTRLRIAGAAAQSNNTGVTYAYLALGDPGMRFLVAGCLKKCKGTVDVITMLAHAGFSALASFLWFESTGGSSTNGLHYKGPGHAASNISPINVGEFTNALVFNAVGQITSKPGLMGSNGFDDMAFLLSRMDDASEGAAGKVLQILSYTGNGAASRTIALTPASGKRPMFAFVVPHNGATLFRDPYYLTTNSAAWNTGGVNPANGIIGGGIDQIIVASAINSTGVVYDVWVVPGSDVAGNGGWSVPGEFMPLAPDAPPGAPTDDGSIDHAEPGPDPPVPDPPPDPPPGGTGTACSAALPFDVG